MKILMVIPYFVPAWSYGGPVKCCFDLSKALINTGHEVTVVTTDALDEKNRVRNLSENIEGIHVFRFRNVSNKAAKNFNLYLPLGFSRWIKNNINQFDAVYCHDAFTWLNVVAGKAAYKNQTPYYIQPHGALDTVRRQSRFSIVKKMFLDQFNLIFERASRIIALTKVEEETIKNINPKYQVSVVPNGLILADFANAKKIDLHQKYNLSKGSKTIGFIGRLQWIKGVDISLEILAQIKNKINFEFLIIGPNEGEKDRLTQLAANLGLSDRVKFLGILTGAEKLNTIKSCDLFLFTSRSEGLPMTVLEVAALSVPQVISDKCNVPELALREAGYEFKLDEKEKIAESIIQILSDQKMHQKMAYNSRKMVEKYFDLTVVANKVISILEKQV